MEAQRSRKMANIEQFASKVVNFSSQYGTAGTSSYTASNLALGLNVYPKYGDFTEAFVLVSCHGVTVISTVPSESQASAPEKLIIMYNYMDP